MNRIVGTLLVCLLIGVQTITLAHAPGHKVELPQEPCAVCVASGVLASAVTDTGPVYAGRFVAALECGEFLQVPPVAITEIPRQRGPPVQL